MWAWHLVSSNTHCLRCAILFRWCSSCHHPQVGFLVGRLPVCILLYFTVKYSIIFHNTVFYCETWERNKQIPCTTGPIIGLYQFTSLSLFPSDSCSCSLYPSGLRSPSLTLSRFLAELFSSCSKPLSPPTSVSLPTPVRIPASKPTSWLLTSIRSSILVWVAPAGGQSNTGSRKSKS